MPKELLHERYPEIAFLLQFTPLESFEERPLEKVILPKHLEKLEVIYVYGLGAGLYYEALEEWLSLKKERVLVFLEDKIEGIAAFLKTPFAKKVLKNSQVHIHLAVNPKMWDALLEDVVLRYPSKYIKVLAIDSYAKKLKSLSLKIYRKSSSLNALFSEVLHYHKLLKNLFPNFRRLGNSFSANQLKGRFKDIPAIICGAGPSLANCIPTLKTLEHKALIFGGGSTLSALSSHGIIPHFGMALDPNEEEYLRLEPSSIFENPFLYANRLLPSVFSFCNGPFGYLRTDTGGIAESFLEEKLEIVDEVIGPDLGNEAFSVTTLEVAFAKMLGCNPIILVGVDLAFTGGKRYASGVMEDASIKIEELEKETKVEDLLLTRKDKRGNTVYTLVKWVMESDAIAKFAKKHKKHIFLNATEEGLGFKGIEDISLEKAASQYCQKTFDLRGKIHAEIQRAVLPQTANHAHVEKVLDELKESLQRSKELLEKIVQELESSKNLESGKFLILRIDLEEEMAFDALLQQIGPVLDKMTARFFHQASEEKLFKRELSKYREILSIVHYIQDEQRE